MNQTIIHLIAAITFSAGLTLEKGCAPAVPAEPNSVPVAEETVMQPDKTPIEAPIPQTEREWKQKLSRKQYYVLREKGTERAFTGKYDKFFEPGTYKCAGCGNELFISDDKYNSGCGWPAFSAPADKDAVAESRDTSHGMIRTEITCSKCGGHLGHVFNDGPRPTGLRYCINSAALDFEEKQDKQEKQD
jgi:peptide-methionine (R)-S-oxide reductase